MKRKYMLLVCITIVFLLDSFSFGYRHEKKIEQSFPLNPEGMVRLKTQRGDINISTHGGNEISIEAIIYANEVTELDRMAVEFETAADSVFIYTSPAAGSVKADIDYYLKVPENLNTLQLSTLSGEIKLKGKYNEFRLTTVNGDIDVSGDFARGELKSTNGDIQVYMKGVLRGDISAGSVNGSIKIMLKNDSGFIVEGRSVTGSIRSEFNREISITGGREGSHIAGTYNNGANKISLATQNGDIRLLKH